MPDEEYLSESLRKIAKGAGISFIGALSHLSRMIARLGFYSQFLTQ